MSVRLNSGSNTDENSLHFSKFDSNSPNAFDLIEGINHDCSHAISHGTKNFSFRFIVAMHLDTLGREADRLGHCQLTTGTDIEPDIRTFDPSGYLLGDKGFGCVVDGSSLRSERRLQGALPISCPLSEIIFIHDVERSTKFGCEIARAQAADR